MELTLVVNPQRILNILWETNLSLLIVLFAASVFAFMVLLYITLFLVAPIPRPPRFTEKTYKTILPDGRVSDSEQLPCWLDRWNAHKALAQRVKHVEKHYDLEPAEVYMSVVVPAYNEEQRLGGMLEEAVLFLQAEYGDARQQSGLETLEPRRLGKRVNGSVHNHTSQEHYVKGWEILVISDGSTDNTVETALAFAKEHQLSQHPIPIQGPWKKPKQATRVPHGSIRVIALEKNRGKGGAVIHGMRHVRGQYIVFADADGASKFDDLAKLMKRCKAVEDDMGRGVAVGSRAHLVGSEAVVKRSKLRNFLMYGFHMFIWLMTPRVTASIKDTQCGFKLFSRSALPYIIPYMHCDGWIFDVEMLMLAEFSGIQIAEVPIGWKEVLGSKLNVIWASLDMAWSLAVLRLAWTVGVYRRD